MSKETRAKRWSEIQKHLMTGLSYMIPIIVAAGTLIGIASLSGQMLGFDPKDAKLLESGNEFIKFMAWVSQSVGNNFMNLMYPILSGYIAYSISDRPGLAPGFLGGLLANSMGAGFLGAMLIGFLAGETINLINRKIKVSRQYIGVKSMFIMPVVGCLIVVILSKYIVAPIGIGFTNACNWFIKSIGQQGGAILAGVLGGAASFDLGGPVNKTAGAIQKQLFFDTNFTYAPRVLGCIVPPIGIGLATIIDKYVVGKKVFPPELSMAGKPCFILGFLGISEGSLPFAISDPVGTIPVCVVGGFVSSAMAFSFGCYTFAGVPYGFYGWLLISNILGFLISLAVGTVIVSLGMIFRRNYLFKKEQAKLERELANSKK